MIHEPFGEHCWHWSGGGSLQNSDGTYSNTLGEHRSVCCWCGAKWRETSKHEKYRDGEHGTHAPWATRKVLVDETKPDPHCPNKPTATQLNLAESA